MAVMYFHRILNHVVMINLTPSPQKLVLHNWSGGEEIERTGIAEHNGKVIRNTLVALEWKLVEWQQE